MSGSGPGEPGDEATGRGAPRSRAGAGEERDAGSVWHNRLQRRRDKIAEEIARNRRGEYRVPTWVLTLALVLIVAGWLALVLLS